MMKRAWAPASGLTGLIAACVSALIILGLSAVHSPAAADLRLCNKTSSRVSVAVGYKDQKGWASEGWWTMEPQKCLTLLKGELIARYYYIYAVDNDKGGSWFGNAMMCIRDKIFTIRGIGNCEERGYEKVGFYEVDTGEATDWETQLTEKAPATQ